MLDRETKSSYEVMVEISDGRDAQGNPDTDVDDDISVTIRVTEVNEFPEFP